MKLGVIVNNKFSRALTQLSNLPVPISVAYKIATLLERVQQEQAKFSSLRKKIIDKHAELDEAGKPKLNVEKTEYLIVNPVAFDKEMEELLALEVALPKIELSEIKNVSLDAATVLALKDVLKP